MRRSHYAERSFIRQIHPNTKYGMSSAPIEQQSHSPAGISFVHSNRPISQKGNLNYPHSQRIAGIVPRQSKLINPYILPDQRFSQKGRANNLSVSSSAREAIVVKQREHNRSDIRGRVIKGSSWRFQERVGSIPESMRYLKRSETPIETREITAKTSARNSMFEIVSPNIKKPSLFQVSPVGQCYEYVMRFSHRTKKGFIPNNFEKMNQDVYITAPNLHETTSEHFFAICDGHGPLGHHVSSYIRNVLPQCVAQSKILLKHPREGLTRAYEAAYGKLIKQSGIDMSFSGSTVIGCYMNQNRLFCANVGDSRAVLGRCNNSSWSAIALSQDHKPSIEKQADRIRRMKGRVEPYKDEFGQPIGPLRVWVQNDNVPGLAMTRSFGDLVGASVGVLAIPEVKEFILTETDRIIVIGSDGVFEFLSNEEIINAMVPYYLNKQVQQASDHLLGMAHRSWGKNSSIVDDITFILIFLNYGQN